MTLRKSHGSFSLSAIALGVAAALHCANAQAQAQGQPVRNPVTDTDEIVQEVFANGTMVLTDQNNVIWIGTTAVNSVFTDPDNAPGETFTVTVQSHVTTGTPPRIIGLVVRDNRTPANTRTINLVRDAGSLGGTAGAPAVPGGPIPVTIPPGNANVFTRPERGATGSGGDNGWGVRICIIECWTIGENAEGGDPGQQGPDFTEVVNRPPITVSSNDLPGVWVSSIGGDGGEGGDAVISLGIQGANGGAAGRGGHINVTNNSDITTTGVGSYGFWVQSRAGRGGEGGSGFQAAGGHGGPAAQGGDPTVTNNGDITTTNDGAIGVFVQSLGGGGGNGGDSYGLVGTGGSAAEGGHGGNVIVTNNATINTGGVAAHGIAAQSIGGSGGDAGDSNTAILGMGGNANTGGEGGTVQVTNNFGANIRTDGRGAFAILAQSVGGGGGNGGTGTGIAGLGGIGSGGGQGRAVRVDNYANLTTTDDAAHAIVAQSIGGGGGTGGTGAGLVGVGGGNTASGQGGTVNVHNHRTGNGSPEIVTTGVWSHGILAQSIGGGGGAGASSASAIDLGGEGGAAGDGGIVTVGSAANIRTTGARSSGIVAQSIGGGGGSASSSSTLVKLGGEGGAGGNGSTVNVTNDGNILTEGDGGSGIVAQSIGGGGGDGGSGAGLVALGGAGTSGGAGGNVNVTNNGTITTLGTRARGILAESIGGGGGTGGDGGGLASIGGNGSSTSPGFPVHVINNGVISTQGSLANAIEASSIGGGGGSGGSSGGAFLTIGGRGGTGGAGGALTVDNNRNLVTTGDDANGIFAQSVGGGGGNGGNSTALTAFAGAAVGGSGAAGGAASTVTLNAADLTTTVGGQTVTVRPIIHTSGDRAKGILAQSVGGGGGNGGFAAQVAGGYSGAASAAVGGSGGGGGNGNDVFINGNTTIVTDGQDADGIVAQSIGGGGGNGGFAVAFAGSIGDVVGASFAAGIGGRGGDAGNGQRVQLRAGGDIITNGDQSDGIVAQSVGGGGGNGGFSITIAAAGSLGVAGAAAVGIGGDGGNGGASGTVDSQYTGNITTHGDDAFGAVLQGIGGGGGSGGFSVSGAVTAAGGAGAAGAIGVGGSGGLGGNGGVVLSTITGDVHTAGDRSTGIIAQSVGGRGGNGGFNISGSIAGGGSAAGAVAVGVGGAGGGGGNANTVTATLVGDALTEGVDADAFVAQSIGGGGGNGGMNVSGTVAGAGSTAGAVSVGIGGAGGGAGFGQQVDATVTGNIGTLGQGSNALVAQSVGGGGGNGGLNVSGSLSGSGATSGAVSVGIGGSGGGGGNGGIVHATLTGSAETLGDNATAVIAQSLGGGGGNGGLNVSGAVSASGSTSGAVAVGIGGSGANGGNAQLTTVTVNGDVATAGRNSGGVLAQSVGGGGGNGGMNVSGALSASGSTSGAVAVGIGGSGDAGGNGGQVTATLTGNVHTQGTQSAGVTAQSIGGSGGNGGLNVSGAFSASGGNSGAVAVGVGASGGGAGNANSAAANVTGHITTQGRGSNALLVQSLGGGGGSGGLNVTGSFNGSGSTGGAVAVGVGGSGGGGGNALEARATLTGTATTLADDSVAVIAQSLGGGGGNGSMNITGAATAGGSDAGAVAVGIGGSGGAAGTGNLSWLRVTGSVATGGNNAGGVLAQSLGGGGGNGGLNVGGAVTLAGGSGAAIAVGVGGSGAGGGAAGRVDAIVDGNVQTQGHRSVGVTAQSIGGGGGNGGMNVTGSLTATGSSNASIAVGVGGAGGGAGSGARVDATVRNGLVSTAGDDSHGVLVQSVGGGGGSGGMNVSGSVSASAANGGSIAVGVGGSGGGGGNGGAVDGHVLADVLTQGDDAYGVIVQSVGGGGGNGALNVSGALALTKGGAGALSVGLGGFGGTAGNGLDVDATVVGNVLTQGDRSIGVLAQSVGGGGGNGGMNISGAVSISKESGGAIALGAGGFGAGGGNANVVGLTRTGSTITQGANAHGVVAQSIGGGGGNGGMNISGALGGSTSGTGLAASLGLGGFGAGGGNAAAVTANVTGDVLATGYAGLSYGFDEDGNFQRSITQGSNGVLAQSVGGAGGNGGVNISGGIALSRPSSGQSHSLTLGVGGFGGAGGNGGAVDLDVTAGVVRSVGDDRFGVGAQSIGGGGGNGGMNISGGIAMDGAITAGIGGFGGAGGTGGIVNAAAITDITAIGDNAIGFLAQSVGGGGGNGGINISGSLQGSSQTSRPTLNFGLGGFGGAGNVSNTVDATQRGDIRVQGGGSVGVLAQSVAGGGGAGALNVTGNAARGTGFNTSIGIGGSGGDGANAARVTLISDGNIFADGREAPESTLVLTDAQREAAEQRERAIGVLVQSVGGGGGLAGVNLTGLYAPMGDTLTAGVGGSGGSGGDGGAVYVRRGQLAAGLIETAGHNADGLIAQSVGGGGGDAEMNFMVSATDEDSQAINIGVGGSGGAPGDGDVVDVLHAGDILTRGRYSNGLFAQSVGGGGGSAALNISDNHTEGKAFNLAIGGGTGPGGHGGNVRVDHTGNIATVGDASNAIFAQSVGGGGGSTGTDIVTSEDSSGGIDIALGRAGGAGGTGGEVRVSSDGDLSTEGYRSVGIRAQSVGNGGGESSSSSFEVSGEPEDEDSEESEEGRDWAMSFEVGFDGGIGGIARSVTVLAEGSITTLGDEAHGIFAQSTGGGGGDGGAIERHPAATASHQVQIGVGGNGGSGGVAGAVDVDNAADISTSGDKAHGIWAQSLGGGGGNGGYTAAVDFEEGDDEDGDGVSQGGQTLAISVGGTGGSGSTGNTVDVTNRGRIVTVGRESHGINAESLGGGGGSGGALLSIGTSGGNSSRSLSVNVGGQGGIGGVADDVTVINEGTIATLGDSAVGIRAKSVGGKGGDAGLMIQIGTLDVGPDQSAMRVNINVGGDGGAGGTGGDVSVENRAIAGDEDSGVIATQGRESHGIFAQSIGGGGGNGSSIITANTGTSDRGQVTLVDLAFGGRGGDGSAAGAVTVTNDSVIDTEGEEAHGIFAQSLGGGGGNGGLVIAANAVIASGDAANEAMVTIGGAGGTGDDAGDVTVNNSGRIITRGDRAHGILAQSIGGGGGNAGLGVGLSTNPLSMVMAGALSAAFGGEGGDGGRGGHVTVNHSGDITVLGTGSQAVVAESINGGGGHVTFDLNGIATLPGVPDEVYDTLPLPSGIEAANPALVFFGGGQGQTEYDAGNVTLNYTGTFGVAGNNGAANAVQAIGGGGGTFDLTLGMNDVASAADDVNIQGRLGGADGTHNRGGDIASTHDGNLVTEGDNTPGALVQSVGGGGGRANLALTSQYDSVGTTDITLGGSGGTNEAGGDISHTQNGSVTTLGAAAHGGVFQSVGGGGGSLSLLANEGDATSAGANKREDGTGHGNSPRPRTAALGLLVPQLAFGSQGGSGIGGGNVTLALDGNVETGGDNAVGMVFQSVGAGGGVASVLGVDGLAVTLGGSGGASGDGGALSVINTGNVLTSGNRSHGVFLQSIGGGGSALFTDALDPLVSLSANNTGNGGAIAFTQNGTILAEGAGAYGLFAQSIGGGGGFVDGGYTGSAGGAGGAGAIDLVVNGDIGALGLGGIALFAQSTGANGLGGNITADLAAGNQLVAGEDGVAVYFDGGATNRFTNRGDVLTLSGPQGFAFRGGAGGDTFQNDGSVMGNFDFGGGVNAFANGVGAILYSGNTIDLGGPANVLRNAGLVSPGAAGLAVHTQLNGSFEQLAGAVADLELDFLARAGDRITATGTANVAGRVNLALMNVDRILPGTHFQPFFTAAGGAVDRGIDFRPQRSIVIDYYLQSRGTEIGALYDVDFNADGLRGNRREVGEYLNRVQLAGGPRDLGDTITVAVLETDLGDYSTLLTQLGTEFYAEQQALALAGAQRFGRNLQNCGASHIGETAGDETGCFWARYDDNPSTRDSGAGFPESEDQSFSISSGVQVPRDDGWTLGFAMDFEDHRVTGYEGLWTAESKLIQFGASARRAVGGGSFGATLAIGNNAQSVNRFVGVADAAQAEGERNVMFLTNVLDYTHAASAGAFTFEPSFNVGTSFLSHGNMTEQGAGANNAEIHGGSETHLWVEPALGLRHDASFGSGAELRTYARLALLQYLSGTSTKVRAGLEGAPDAAAPMRIGSDLDRTQFVGELGVQYQTAAGFTMSMSYTTQNGEFREGGAGSLRFVLPLQ